MTSCLHLYSRGNTDMGVALNDSLDERMSFGKEPLDVAHGMGDVHFDDGVGKVVTNDRVEELGVINVED
jgi:hypothetical protein